VPALEEGAVFVAELFEHPAHNSIVELQMRTKRQPVFINASMLRRLRLESPRTKPLVPQWEREPVSVTRTDLDG
jgi:hypothetical protein